jgi:methylase of polypeptide subunit release factors
MDGKPLIYSLEFDANSLRMIIANPPFLPGRERRIVLSRIE